MNIKKVNVFHYFTATAPAMVIPPNNETVLAGQDATFTCRASGAPTPNITWMFNGQNLFILFLNIEYKIILIKN